MVDRIIKNCKNCGKTFEISKFNSYINLCEECRKKESQENKKLKKEKEAESLKKKRLEERNYKPYICEFCGKEFSEDFRKTIENIKKTNPRFCSEKCAKAYSSGHVDRSKKRTECVVCGEIIDIDCRIYKDLKINGIRCKKCINKEKRESKYKFEKNTELGKFERSHLYRNKSPNLIRMGFDFENDLESEYFKLKNKLANLYYVEKNSMTEIMKLYKLPSIRGMKSIFNNFQIKSRTFREGLLIWSKNNYFLEDIGGAYQYNHGYEILKGVKYYYRSNYELIMMRFLSEKNINFDLNKFKISYISSEDKLEHTAFPDFFLRDYSTIVETKSLYRYDEKNIEDRYYTCIKNLNYNFLVISCEGNYSKKGFKFKRFEILNKFIDPLHKTEAEYLLNLIENYGNI